MYEKNRISIRFNEEIHKKLLDLIKKNEDFRSFSQVFRAGVMALHRERAKGGRL